MNSEAQVKEKLGQVVQNSQLPFAINMTLRALSI